LSAIDFLGQVRDVRHHPRDRQAVVGDGARGLVLALAEARVTRDGLASHRVERDVLRRQARRGRDHHRVAQVLGVRQRPFEHLHAAQRAAEGRQQPLDAEVVDHRAMDRDEVAHVEEREVQPVRVARRRVDAGRSRRALAAAEKVGADHVQTVGVERPSRPDHVVPPAGPGVPGVVAGRVRVARQCMAEEHRVVTCGVQRPVRLVRHVDLGQGPPTHQVQGVGLVEQPHGPGLDDPD
jgi:hypothetical protein